MAAASFSSCDGCRLGGCQLAVLHPRKLVIYRITSLASGQDVAALQLCTLAEQVLELSAANMVCGNFGGDSTNGIISLSLPMQPTGLSNSLSHEFAAGAQHICIQSMDGRLSFYERETIAFSRFLPQFLLPGPLCYSQALDFIITCSSAFEVECYKYQTLAAAQAAAEKTKGKYNKLAIRLNLHQTQADGQVQSVCSRCRGNRQRQAAAHRMEMGVWRDGLGYPDGKLYRSASYIGCKPANQVLLLLLLNSNNLMTDAWQPVAATQQTDFYGV